MHVCALRLAGMLAGVALGSVSLGSGLVWAQPLPRPTGYVSDYANLLSASSERALTTRLEALDRQTGIQLAVVTVTSLEGQSVERYATQLFNTWGIGRAETDSGVLVLVAPRDRQMRIEVGTGLERVLTNDIAAGLVDAHFLPSFRERRFQQGIETGVDRIIAVLQGRRTASREAATPVERAAAPPGRVATPSRSTPVDDALGVLRWMPRPIQILLLVIGLSVGADRLGRGLRERAVLVPIGLLIGGVAAAAWWFPFSGWGIPGWLLLGGWTWLVFSAAWRPPPTVKRHEPAETAETAETAEPPLTSAATAASPDDEPWFLRRYTRGDPFAHEPDERPRRARPRLGGLRRGSSGSGGSGGFGGGSSSGGGATGKW